VDFKGAHSVLLPVAPLGHGHQTRAARTVSTATGTAEPIDGHTDRSARSREAARVAAARLV
jgi:hypothetical protein